MFPSHPYKGISHPHKKHTFNPHADSKHQLDLNCLVAILLQYCLILTISHDNEARDKY